MTAKLQYLITGGSSGVGYAIALGLAERGLPVMLASRDPVRGPAACDMIRARTGNQAVRWLPLDLTSRTSIAALVSTLEKEGVTVRVLSHNAALFYFNHPDPDWARQQMLEANVLGPVRLTLALQERGRFSGNTRILATAGSPGVLNIFKRHAATVLRQGRFLPLAYVRTIVLRAAVFLRLSEKLAQDQIGTFVFHPGAVRTQLLSRAPWWLRMPLALITRLLPARCPVGVDLATQSGPAKRAAEGVRLRADRVVPWHADDDAVAELLRSL